MTMAEALENLGVDQTILTADEKAFLDENGYLPLEAILSREEVTAFAKRLDELALEEGDDAGKEVHQEAGTTRLSNLVDKDRMFEKCVTHPKVLASMQHVLGSDFKFSSLNSRSALPGHGHQALHADWHEGVCPGDYFACNSIWLIDEFTAANGATCVVPGSHRSGTLPAAGMADPEEDHPDQVQLLSGAGTVVIFNSHTWHGGLRNETDSPRRAMHSYFCRRNQRQQLDQREFLRPETIARLPQETRVILDVDNG